MFIPIYNIHLFLWHEKERMIQQTKHSILLCTWKARMWRWSLIWLMVVITNITNIIIKKIKHPGRTIRLGNNPKISFKAAKAMGYMPENFQPSLRRHKWDTLTRIDKNAKVNPHNTINQTFFMILTDNIKWMLNHHRTAKQSPWSQRDNSIWWLHT